MKIRTKFLLMLCCLSIFLGAGIIIPGYLKIRAFESDQADYYLRDRVLQLVQEVKDSHATLHNAGVSEIESYVMAAKKRVIDAMRDVRTGEKVNIHVLDENDAVLLSTVTDSARVAPKDLMLERMPGRSGRREVSSESGTWRVVFNRDNPWNWTIVSAMPLKIVYRESQAYLYFVLAVGFGVALTILGLYHLLTNQVRQRLDTILSRVDDYRRGRYDQPLEVAGHDEIGKLSRGLNAMMDSISREIRTRKEVERKLVSAKIDADNANRAKSEFLANMSHEIRNPLNSVIGFSELLATTALDKEQQGYVKFLTHASQNLTATIDDILDLTKIEFGVVEIVPEHFDLREDVKVTFEMFAFQGARKGLDMACSIGDDVPLIIYGDKARCSEIVTNLVGNAIKYTERGRVEVDMQLHDQTAEHHVIRIEVRDTGIGIDEEKQAEIFKAFSRVDTVSNGNGVDGRSTGLGLAIVQRLVRLMNGSISVRSAPGKGSVFTVLLPFEKTRQDRMEPGQENRKLAASRDVLKALVADDDVLNQQYVYQILHKNNFDVVLVDNGKLAVEKLREESFDIILMDIRMPVMNGVEAMESIRNDLQPPACNTPIIALTANAYESDIKRYYEAGASAYLAKPCRPERLMETVDEALRDHATAIRA